MFDGVAAEILSGGRREQWVTGRSASLGEPHTQHSDGRRNEECPALLAAFSDAVDMRADAEDDIVAGERDQLRYPQSGLHGEQNHCVVPPTGPGGTVASGQ